MNPTQEEKNKALVLEDYPYQPDINSTLVRPIWVQDYQLFIHKLTFRPRAQCNLRDSKKLIATGAAG